MFFSGKRAIYSKSLLEFQLARSIYDGIKVCISVKNAMTH